MDKKKIIQFFSKKKNIQISFYFASIEMHLSEEDKLIL